MQHNGCSTGSSAKHIILVIWQASLGGIEKSLTDYFRYFSHRFQFTLYALKSYNRKIDIYGQYKVDIRTGHKNTAILYIKFFLYALNNRKTTFHIFNAGPVILLLLRLAGVKRIIYHIRGTVYWRGKRQKFVQKLFWQLAIHPGAVFIANSKHSRQRFLDQVNEKVAVIVIYNPFDTESLISLEKITGNGITVKYAGRLATGKNLELWIDIAAHVNKEIPGTKFRLAGEGPLRKKLEAKVNEMNLGDVIRFDGYISDKEKIYADCDVLLFLSDHESFGNVVVESILANTPVIASSIPSMKEIFAGYPDFIVDLDDRIYNTVTEKIRNLDHLRVLTLKARKEFAERFSLKKHFDEIEKLYLA